MDGVELFVGVMLPYLAVLVFVGGMIWRVGSWLRLAAPPMTLFPVPPTAAATMLDTAGEIVLFRSLFRSDRVLWTLAWVFHAVLALIFLGHFRVFTGVFDAMLQSLGMSPPAIQALSSGAGGAAGIVILAMILLLLARRIGVPRVREITGPADYLALILIGAVVLTGNMMRFGSSHFDLELTRDYFAALATFSNVAEMPALESRIFLVHMGLALVLIMLIPFSKILHFGGIFFTQQLIRKQ